MKSKNDRQKIRSGGFDSLDMFYYSNKKNDRKHRPKVGESVLSKRIRNEQNIVVSASSDSIAFISSQEMNPIDH